MYQRASLRAPYAAMEVRKISIATALGAAEMEAVLTETRTGWTATLLPKPGYSFGAAAKGADEEQALGKLAELAQKLYEEQVEREVRLYGPRTGGSVPA